MVGNLALLRQWTFTSKNTTLRGVSSAPIINGRECGGFRIPIIGGTVIREAGTGLASGERPTDAVERHEALGGCHNASVKGTKRSADVFGQKTNGNESQPVKKQRIEETTDMWRKKICKGYVLYFRLATADTPYTYATPRGTITEMWHMHIRVENRFVVKNGKKKHAFHCTLRNGSFRNSDTEAMAFHYGRQGNTLSFFGNPRYKDGPGVGFDAMMIDYYKKWCIVMGKRDKISHV